MRHRVNPERSGGPRTSFARWSICTLIPPDPHREVLVLRSDARLLRPLEQLRLPIQAQREREHRSRALDAKAGLLNLYNDLLQLRISIGTATRFIRRFLGFRGAGAIPSAWKRVLAQGLELFRTWTLIGYHLG